MESEVIGSVEDVTFRLKEQQIWSSRRNHLKQSLNKVRTDCWREISALRKLLLDMT